ncbi:WG repeat-containing protein [Brevibacillus sp. BC25]|uniref:WG repeat-containing protein n=1 Tax=Brevibacillus sp. BC25 TaxID=1144308 RepID=UPI0002713F4B|nr:WG repeat-containing protein [Brevibacillus sp. BC25]EJL30753.1 KWG repeat protein [Brevibacillus sp. BC25]
MKRFTIMAVSIAAMLFSPVIASAKEGVINSKGEWSVAPTFEEVKDTGGLYAATLGDSPANQSWGFIDQRGKWVIKPQFSYVGSFAANGLAPAAQNLKYGYINKRENGSSSHSLTMPPIFPRMDSLRLA